jgi:hypothetical protein
MMIEEGEGKMEDGRRKGEIRDCAETKKILYCGSNECYDCSKCDQMEYAHVI